MPCIRYGELYTTYGVLIDKVLSRTNTSADQLVISKGGEVIIPASGEAALDIATASLVLEAGVALGGDLNIIQSELNGVFLSYYLNSRRKFDIARLAQGNSVVHLYSSQLSTLTIFKPTLEEQQKIATFLRTVDDKINKLRRKRELLESYKRGLMQKLFSQEIRFKQDDAFDFPDWVEISFGSLFTERSEKGHEKLELLSVKTIGGVVKRSDIEGKNNASQDRSNYKRVLPGDIAYNSMRMWQGASGLSAFKGIVSPAYTVVTPNNDCDPVFFSYLFKYPPLVFNFRRYSQGLTSDTWNLKYPAFSNIKWKLPTSILEQKKITIVFQEMDAKISKLEEIIHAMETFKKGLLQKIFV